MQPAKNPNNQIDDKRLAQLLVLCQRGDESAFEELYTGCSARLFGALLRIPGVEAIADVALQASFVAIWREAGNYKPWSVSPMAWIYGIARDQALGLLKERGFQGDDESSGNKGRVDSEIDPAKTGQRNSDDSDPLTRCLATLSEDARECIVRSYCEGYSHEELAARAGMPVDDVKSLIRRGLHALAKRVNECS